MAGKTGWGPRALTVPAVAAGTSKTVITAPCRLKGWSLFGAASTQPHNTHGAVTGPGAGGLVAAFTVPAGTWTFTVQLYIDGTTTAADDDNMEISVGGDIIPCVVPAVIGQGGGNVVSYTFPALATGGSVQVLAIAAAGAAAVYHASIIAVSTSPAAQILDGAQVLAAPAMLYDCSSDIWLGNEGIFVGGQIAVSAITGTISGVLFVDDFISDDEMRLWQQMKYTSSSSPPLPAR